MNQQVSPLLLIGVGIIAAGLLVFFFIRSVTPHAPAYTVPPPNMASDSADARRQNYLKLHGGSAPGGAPAPAVPKSDRTGE